MKKINTRKNVKILPAHWRKLKKLALNREMTLQSFMDEILGSLLACAENPELGKEK
jgi:predicted DNA-binding ribbon-helix-helix protein